MTICRFLPPLCAAALCTMLTACGPADNDPGPGGVTVSEARELDQAAEMLDAQRIETDGQASEAPVPENAEPTNPAE